MDEQVAARLYINRKNGTEHPDGRFLHNGVWIPSDTEVRWCCETIRRPSMMHPYAFLSHCRTIKHIAIMFDVDERRLRALIREMQVDLKLMQALARDF